MTDKEIDKRIEKLKKSIAADKADNSWHFIGAPPYIIGADFLDELFKRLEGAKSESAALREKLEAVEEKRDAYKRAKEYWDSLYGQGLEIAKWHMNGKTEPFDNFWESAEDEYLGGL